MRYRKPLKESRIHRRRMIRESIEFYRWGKNSLPGGQNYEFVEVDDEGNEYRGGDIVCFDIHSVPISRLKQIGLEIGLNVDQVDISGRTVRFIDDQDFEVGYLDPIR